jgi:hypothetical protein
MNTGKNLVEIIRLSNDVAYENAVLIPDGKKIYRYDPETEWFTEQLVTGADAVESEPAPVPEGALLPASGWVEVTPASQKITIASLQEGLSQHRVPLAGKKTVPSRTKVPRLPVMMMLRKEYPAAKKVVEAEPQIAPPPHVVEAQPQPELEPKPAPEPKIRLKPRPELKPEPKPKPRAESEPVMESKPEREPERGPVPSSREVKVTVLPTPKKRQRKIVEPKEETAALPPSRPLKVIRRRREEEPKVFETPAKTFPQVLLEGVKSSPTESGE